VWAGPWPLGLRVPWNSPGGTGGGGCIADWGIRAPLTILGPVGSYVFIEMSLQSPNLSLCTCQ